MMVQYGALKRTGQEFQDLLRSAGFGLAGPIGISLTHRLCWKAEGSADTTL
jgi:hypothetical protein